MERGKLTFHSEHQREADNRPLLHIRRDVRHKRQILDQTTRLSLGRIARTEHAPLTRLQGSRAADLSRLFKLRGYPRHHPQRGYEAQATQNVRHARALHLESFQGPVPGGDGAHEAGGDVVPLELEGVERVELVGARGLFEDFVD